MTTVADYEWRMIRDDPRDGPTQMALEEIAAETAIDTDVRTVRVYSWEPGTLSLGYHQDPNTIDWEYCNRKGIPVTRRQTGGGGIYHDRYADISYTIVAPAEEVPGNLMDCYKLFCEPILNAFERMGIDAGFASADQPTIFQPSCYLRDINPAHDIVVASDDGEAKNAGAGQKISGNAQYRQQDVVIQHGSISYDLVPDRHLGVFTGHDLDTDTFTDRVTSIREHVGIDRDEAVSIIGDALADWCGAREGDWSESELNDAATLANRKFGATEWVRNKETVKA